MAVKNKDANRLITSTGVDVEVPSDLQGNLDFDVNNALLSSTELTDMAGDQAKQLMTGEIPDDLKEQVSDLSTSKGMQGGFGYGEAGRKLEARDFGITSMDLKTRGSEMALAVSESKNQTTELFNNVRTADRNYQLALMSKDIERTQVALMGMDLVTKNQQYVSGLMNELIINNSKKEIDGLQGNIDALAGNTETGQAGYFDSANATILDLISRYM